VRRDRRERSSSAPSGRGEPGRGSTLHSPIRRSMMKRLVQSTVVLVALALPLAAAVRFDPADAARRLAPFLDEQAVAVARADLTTLDVDDLFDRAGKLTGLPAAQLAEPRRHVRDVLARLRKAGARELYAVVSVADLPAPGPFLLAFTG